ncbi:aminodeoxychorismate/anthranilate synthase component II [Clostridium sp. MSJ-8]|uniref:anthranilate synthase component II n=1 Tax=Clostridium sp. MSJ-8 TaxID=2841510 RepID=UPI001C0E9DB8|nr:aminodeoxychorismate/anthranilate synthase component II [Clostridium sp. MSJ-8]MBU5487853.1 aminodeoxychorismate/anthranilate synthase component II [Clostridium sp. MSJ-8]
MLLMIDNYDSFVYNLVRYFRELDEDIEVYRNDKITIEEIEEKHYEGIIISPGPKNPKEAGLSLEIINKFKGKVPILGICLGHQCIGESFNAKITKGEYPVHGKVSKVIHNNEGIFKDLKNPLNVTRYHSLIVSKIDFPEELVITAETSDGVIMGIRHREYPIYGVQFHPEAELTEEGHKLLKNFIYECKRFNNEF